MLLTLFRLYDILANTIKRSMFFSYFDLSTILACSAYCVVSVFLTEYTEIREKNQAWTESY